MNKPPDELTPGDVILHNGQPVTVHGICYDGTSYTLTVEDAAGRWYEVPAGEVVKVKG